MLTLSLAKFCRQTISPSSVPVGPGAHGHAFVKPLLTVAAAGGWGRRLTGKAGRLPHSGRHRGGVLRGGGGWEVSRPRSGARSLPDLHRTQVCALPSVGPGPNSSGLGLRGLQGPVSPTQPGQASVTPIPWASHDLQSTRHHCQGEGGRAPAVPGMERSSSCLLPHLGADPFARDGSEMHWVSRGFQALGRLSLSPPSTVCSVGAGHQ